MKIAFIGPHASGKTTLIQKFLEKWPMFVSPSKTYRDIIKEKSLSINKAGTPEDQKEILNALIDEAQAAASSNKDFIVFDRSVVDNVVYSLWHYAKKTEGFTEDYIIECKTLAALALKHYDILFYVPMHSEIPITERENRDNSPEYREEINNIFRALIGSYEQGAGTFFPLNDCPAVISLEGPPDMRLPQISLYLKDTGQCFGEKDGSLLAV